MLVAISRLIYNKNSFYGNFYAWRSLLCCADGDEVFTLLKNNYIAFLGDFNSCLFLRTSYLNMAEIAARVDLLLPVISTMFKIRINTGCVAVMPSF